MRDTRERKLSDLDKQLIRNQHAAGVPVKQIHAALEQRGVDITLDSVYKFLSREQGDTAEVAKPIIRQTMAKQAKQLTDDLMDRMNVSTKIIVRIEKAMVDDGEDIRLNIDCYTKAAKTWIALHTLAQRAMGLEVQDTPAMASLGEILSAALKKREAAR